MKKDKKIVVGDKVDIMSMNDDIPYKSQIEDIMQEGTLSASMPTSAGLPMLIHIDDELVMSFYRESGRYSVIVRVTDFEDKDQMRTVTLTQLSEPEKDQRRKYYRLPIILNAVICEYTENIEEHLPQSEELAGAAALEIAGTKDVSITGVALMTKQNYMPGNKYVLKLLFDENHRAKAQPFIICAEVMRSEYEPKKNAYRIGMNFFGQTKNMSEFLARYVLRQQQRQVMQRRLVEGE